ncbi:hypothetical protein LABOLPEG_00007 [Pseudomonas phage phi 21A]|nr:hypothetical protein LABOLPEG_00007 [Pseudomonas phage phi 21A]
MLDEELRELVQELVLAPHDNLLASLVPGEHEVRSSAPVASHRLMQDRFAVSVDCPEETVVARSAAVEGRYVQVRGVLVLVVARNGRHHLGVHIGPVRLHREVLGVLGELDALQHDALVALKDEVHVGPNGGRSEDIGALTEGPVRPRLLHDLLVHVEELVDIVPLWLAIAQDGNEVLRSRTGDRVDAVGHVARNVCAYVLCALHVANVLHGVVPLDGRKAGARCAEVNATANAVWPRRVLYVELSGQVQLCRLGREDPGRGQDELGLIGPQQELVGERNGILQDRDTAVRHSNVNRVIVGSGRHRRREQVEILTGPGHHHVLTGKEAQAVPEEEDVIDLSVYQGRHWVRIIVASCPVTPVQHLPVKLAIGCPNESPRHG